jgi:hypothetical protein
MPDISILSILQMLYSVSSYCAVDLFTFDIPEIVEKKVLQTPFVGKEDEGNIDRRQRSMSLGKRVG